MRETCVTQGMAQGAYSLRKRLFWQGLFAQAVLYALENDLKDSQEWPILPLGTVNITYILCSPCRACAVAVYRMLVFDY